jgi:hypothetical protein
MQPNQSQSAEYSHAGQQSRFHLWCLHSEFNEFLH